MIKYIILHYVNPNIKTSKADIKVLCSNGNIYYWSSTKENKKEWVTFMARPAAEELIRQMGLTNAITYGVKESELK